MRIGISFLSVAVLVVIGSCRPGAHKGRPDEQQAPFLTADTIEKRETKVLDPDLFKLIPVHGDFIASLKQQTSTSSDIVYAPFDYSGHLKSADEHRAQKGTPSTSKENDELPVSYDLRKLSRVSSTKDKGEGRFSVAFATLGALETVLSSGSAVDLSENQLKNRSGFDLAVVGGSNIQIANAMITRGEAPVDEQIDPYNAADSSASVELKAKYKIAGTVLALRNKIDDLREIKRTIQSYGGVTSYLYFAEENLKKENFSYFSSTSQMVNLAAVIVGWDDQFSKDNFLQQPAHDGAFIVQLSRGEKLGDKGFIYVSYDDVNFAREDLWAYTKAELAPDGEIVYQYDPFGLVMAAKSKNAQTLWSANIFVTEENETVTAVSFYLPARESSYELKILKKPAENAPDNGDLLSTIKGERAEPGYLRVELPTSLKIAKGTKVAVVVKVSTQEVDKDYNFIPLELPYKGYSSAAASGARESFISHDGTNWFDVVDYFANANVCIKMFATRESKVVPGLSVKRFSPQNADKNVDRATIMNVVFSRRVAAGKSFEQIFLKNKTTERAEEIERKIEFDRVVIKPLKKLDPSTSYLLVLPDGAVREMQGFSLSQRSEINFQTSEL